MRILAGELRGQPISFKAGPHLRPTTDKVRQAIFNMLRGQVEGKRVLDLFSGTGALGLEALSLGALHVTFVETDRHQAKIIEENLVRLGVRQRSDVVKGAVEEVLARLSHKPQAYHIVFLDPPYEKGLGSATLELLSDSSLIEKNTLILMECSKREEVLSFVGRLKNLKSKVYGDTQIAVFGVAQ